MPAQVPPHPAPSEPFPPSPANRLSLPDISVMMRECIKIHRHASGHPTPHQRTHAALCERAAPAQQAAS